MKKAVPVLRIIMPLVAIACLVVFPPWTEIRVWLTPLPDTVQEQVDAAAADYGFDGVIVCVDQSDQAPALYAAGWKNRAEQISADPDALFKIASISKLYIAAAAAKLVNSGQLSLDSTLAGRLPDLAGKIENAERITVRMLLRHRSGVPNFTDQEGFDWSKPSFDLRENLALIYGKPADFAPGARYAYSNTNYLLVGEMLDKTLGYGHQQYIKAEILDPLGLSQTFGTLSEVDLDDVVSGYHHPYEDDLRGVDYVIPGGSMVATARDVAVFMRALIDGTLFTEEEQAVYSSIYSYDHTGWLLGYQSTAQYHADINAAVILFVSTTGGESMMMKSIVYNRIVRILRKQAVRASGI